MNDPRIQKLIDKLQESITELKSIPDDAVLLFYSTVDSGGYTDDPEEVEKLAVGCQVEDAEDRYIITGYLCYETI